MADQALLDQLTKKVNKLAGVLDRRSSKHKLLESYYDGGSPMPAAVKEAKVTQAYRRLMPVADAPWGSLVVDSVLDRLELGGISDKDNEDAATAVWNVWQANHMDSESKLALCSGLISGRVFSLVWPDVDSDDQQPQITLDTADQMIVQYVEGNRFKRQAALRRWRDDDSDQIMATLYLPDAIYKFQQPVASDHSAKDWVPRQEAGDTEWPVENPFGVVPVNEIRFNSRLKAGTFGFARGEYEHCMGLIDRINLLTFLGLVVAFWMGFPLRVLVGEKILRDDDNEVIPPFKVNADTIAQLENPDAALKSWDAADRNNLSVFAELSQLAAITKTPRHYFPLAQAMANLSADAIRADEGGLNAKCTNHKASSGEGWLETLRLIGQQTDQKLSPNASLKWLNHESRSLAEIADAATKLQPILPWQVLAERILNATQDEVARWQAMRADDTMTKLLAAAAHPSNAGSLNGAGNVTPEPPPADAGTPETPATGDVPATPAASG